jgi:putative phosphoesterase
MKIGLISDVHATPDPVEEALTLFRRENVDFTICIGDIAGYGVKLDETVELLLKGKCHVISGNHDVWFIESAVADDKQWIRRYFETLPATLDFTVEDKHVYVVHASPPGSNKKGIILLDEDGEIIPARMELWTKNLKRFNYDVLIVGHTHQVFSEKLGDILVINPGSTKFNHTCAILTLPELEVQIFPLANRAPLKVWNWRQMEKMNEA